jgi:hypothetical protein
MLETPVKVMAQSLKAATKDDACLLAEFYFNAVQLTDSNFFSRQGGKASYMQREALGILKDPETLRLSRKALGVDTASVFSRDFGFEQARAFGTRRSRLHRHNGKAARRPVLEKYMPSIFRPTSRRPRKSGWCG